METNQRPTFLTVLCILSFIAIGLGLLNNLFSLTFTPDADQIIEMQEQMEDAVSDMDDSPLGGGFMEMLMSQSSVALEHAKTLALISIVGLLLCLFGVFKMWNMKKAGYVPYIIGNLAPPIASIVLVGMMGGLALGGLFFPIVFIVLYGLNLKHMS